MRASFDRRGAIAVALVLLGGLACTKTQASADNGRDAGDEEFLNHKMGKMGGRVFEIPDTALPMTLPPADELEIASLAARRLVACVRTTGTHTLCWGRSHGGPHEVPPEKAEEVFSPFDPGLPVCELTDGRPSCREREGEPFVPIPLGRKARVEQIAIGEYHLCFRLASGHMRCTSQASARSPDGRRFWRPDPLSAEILDVPRLSDVVSIAAEGETTAALTRGGKVYRWRGDASRKNPPQLLGQVEGAASIALGATTRSGRDGTRAGSDFVCVLGGGKVLCGGDNDHYQLGLGDTEPREGLTEVPWPPGPTGIEGTIPGVAGVCFRWGTSGGHGEGCVPTGPDARFTAPLPPGHYEVCTQPHEGPGDCPMCFFSVQGGAITRVDASSLRPPTTDQGIFGLSVGIYPEGDRVPHPLRVCAGGPDTEIDAPLADMRCTETNACGRYALDLAAGSYRLHFAKPGGERSESRQWCRFEVGARTKFELERREWRGEPTEPQCPDGAVADPLTLDEVRVLIRWIREDEDIEPMDAARSDELLDYGRRRLLSGDSIEDLAKDLELEALFLRRTLLHGDEELEALVQVR